MDIAFYIYLHVRAYTRIGVRARIRVYMYVRVCIGGRARVCMWVCAVCRSPPHPGGDSLRVCVEAPHRPFVYV